MAGRPGYASVPAGCRASAATLQLGGGAQFDPQIGERAGGCRGLAGDDSH